MIRFTCTTMLDSITDCKRLYSLIRESIINLNVWTITEQNSQTDLTAR